jgi:peptidoglycan/LPS O-acetylase OafA/YrhL
MGQAWLRKVGSLSYGLYVYHVLLLPLFAWLAFHVAPAASRNTYLALVFVIGIALSFAAAYVSYTFFEKPFLRLKKFFPEGTINRLAKSVCTASVSPRLEPG